MARTRVKICGITRPEDGRMAALAGADAIGLVFYAGSPRAVTPEQANAIIARLPPFVVTVGLFVNADPAWIRDVLAACPLDLLQFHGDETPAACRGYDRPYVKAIRMHEAVDLAAEAARYHDARGLLLDAWRADSYGGTGESFDWARIPERIEVPIILAGGLTPVNIAEAIAAVRPWAVDVSSGVEESKGIKSATKVHALMEGVERARE